MGIRQRKEKRKVSRKNKNGKRPGRVGPKKVRILPEMEEYWDDSLRVDENMRKLGLKVNPNEPDFSAAVPFELKQREKEKRAPQPLDEVDYVYMKRLVEKYGDQVDKMARDIKINYRQSSLAELQRSYDRYLLGERK